MTSGNLSTTPLNEVGVGRGKGGSGIAGNKLDVGYGNISFMSSAICSPRISAILSNTLMIVDSTMLSSHIPSLGSLADMFLPAGPYHCDES